MTEENKTILANLVSQKIPFCAFRLPGDQIRIFRLANEKPKTGEYFVVKGWKEVSEPVFFEPFNDATSRAALTAPNQSSKPINTSFDEYAESFHQIKRSIQSGVIHKAILSRILELDTPGGFMPLIFFKSLSEAYPHTLCYLLSHPAEGLWIGASPELLLKKRQDVHSTISLAGTLKNEGEIKWNKKEIEEQELVSQHIREVVESFNPSSFQESSVQTRQAGPVAHLESTFTFKIDKERDFLDIINRLHPTPAIAGLPVDQAKKIILETEKHDRRLYCGYLGYVKENTSADFFVNLRCMQIVEESLFLYLGGGITKDSELKSEWEETINKAKTLTNLMGGQSVS
jgi:isochorismate synthase